MFSNSEMLIINKNPTYFPPFYFTLSVCIISLLAFSLYWQSSSCIYNTDSKFTGNGFDTWNLKRKERIMPCEVQRPFVPLILIFLNQIVAKTLGKVIELTTSKSKLLIIEQPWTFLMTSCNNRREVWNAWSWG